MAAALHQAIPLKPLHQAAPKNKISSNRKQDRRNLTHSTMHLFPEVPFIIESNINLD